MVEVCCTVDIENHWLAVDSNPSKLYEDWEIITVQFGVE